MAAISVGEFKLAIQRSLRAAYAHVALEAHDRPDKVFTIDTTAVDACWRPAVAFGVSYAHEKFTHAGHVLRTHIRVTSVHTMVVDTNQMAVAFASYQAACIAFGVLVCRHADIGTELSKSVHLLRREPGVHGLVRLDESNVLRRSARRIGDVGSGTFLRSAASGAAALGAIFVDALKSIVGVGE